MSISILLIWLWSHYGCMEETIHWCLCPHIPQRLISGSNIRVSHRLWNICSCSPLQPALATGTNTARGQTDPYQHDQQQKELAGPTQGLLGIGYQNIPVQRMARLKDTPRQRRSGLNKREHPFVQCLDNTPESPGLGWAGLGQTTKGFWVWTQYSQIGLGQFSFCIKPFGKSNWHWGICCAYSICPNRNHWSLSLTFKQYWQSWLLKAKYQQQ